MALIAGLGNPGEEYKGTRHNIGFELIDQLSDVLSITMGLKKGTFLSGEGSHKGEPVRLIKPLTYMNKSGQAVKKALNYWNEPVERLLICHDDINLPVGTLRFRPGGSAGGHNGLTDIIEVLQTDRIPRMRIGIGKDFAPGRQSGYVLSPFPPQERHVMDKTLERAVEAVLIFIRDGIENAMNRFN